jgi:hypothetical protein
MPLLHDADVPTIYCDALEAAKPKRGDGEVEQHRLIQVGHERVCHRVDWSEPPQRTRLDLAESSSSGVIQCMASAQACG